MAIVWGDVTALKRVAKSDTFKYVYKYQNGRGKIRWAMMMPATSKFYDTEREAAKAVDLYLIRKGKQPVNGTIRKIPS